MGVRIEKGTKIGNNNAIGDNARVEVKNIQMDSDNKNWFVRHPWFSAILCSLLAGILLLFTFWGKVISGIEELFK